MFVFSSDADDDGRLAGIVPYCVNSIACVGVPFLFGWSVLEASKLHQVKLRQSWTGSLRGFEWHDGQNSVSCLCWAAQEVGASCPKMKRSEVSCRVAVSKRCSGGAWFRWRSWHWDVMKKRWDEVRCAAMWREDRGEQMMRKAITAIRQLETPFTDYGTTKERIDYTFGCFDPM